MPKIKFLGQCCIDIFEQLMATLLTPLVKSWDQHLPFRADETTSLFEGARRATECCFPAPEDARNTFLHSA